jgi:hypothetical protein
MHRKRVMMQAKMRVDRPSAKKEKSSFRLASEAKSPRRRLPCHHVMMIADVVDFNLRDGAYEFHIAFDKNLLTKSSGNSMAERDKRQRAEVRNQKKDGTTDMLLSWREAFAGRGG